MEKLLEIYAAPKALEIFKDKYYFKNYEFPRSREWDWMYIKLDDYSNFWQMIGYEYLFTVLLFILKFTGLSWPILGCLSLSVAYFMRRKLRHQLVQLWMFVLKYVLNFGALNGKYLVVGKNGSILTATFVNDIEKGPGRIIYNSGCSFEGVFDGNKIDG